MYPFTLKRNADLLNYENKIFVSAPKVQKISDEKEVNIYPLVSKRNLRLLDYDKKIIVSECKIQKLEICK